MTEKSYPMDLDEIKGVSIKDYISAVLAPRMTRFNFFLKVFISWFFIGDMKNLSGLLFLIHQQNGKV